MSYDDINRMVCLKLRAKIFLHANEPSLALEDANDVFKEFPMDFGAHCIMAECLYMKGFLERSLSVWHKAAHLRPNVEEVQVSIDKVRNTLMVATRNCFSAPDTNTIIQAMIEDYNSVDNYLNSVSDETEVLTDPNKNLSEKEKRTKKPIPIKVLSSQEKKDEKNLLGTSYSDKEFLKKVYKECSDKELIQEVTEEGFLFLVGRAEFWRQQQPLYSKGNKNLQKSETGESGENSETSETSDSSSARGADIHDSISPPSS
ncbi:tetratricopeptide repeat protein 25 [Eurytemora carolleeae]|uniref:tetratricopeptide repeat protein 25 n=1 Tax=Eurytemora carolleeae TaxID=1294199 RepID=UPI000C78BC62|nr:tetratricopeptide repeat protein 25 [Eurytemora carolleeae]|eukprot:XP_023342714.1 tetratricopeptide repeat protein 25-like [Eurytemora affinis]